MKVLMRENLPGFIILKGIFNSVFYFISIVTIISIVIINSRRLLSMEVTEDSCVKTEFLDLFQEITLSLFLNTVEKWNKYLIKSYIRWHFIYKPRVLVKLHQYFL